jgi:antitoxin component YwqK of YwqJK toxin-antitoxin module
MKQLYVFLFLIFSYLPANAIPDGRVFLKAFETFKEKNEDDKAKNENGRLKISINDNQYEEFYPNGNKKISLGVKQKNLSGKSTSYFRNGQPKEVANFSNNELNGLYTVYKRSGVKDSEFNFKQGLLHGKAKFYKDNEQIYRETNFHEGKKHGHDIAYQKNGLPSMDTEYQNGIKHGEVKKYNPNGEVKSLQLYQNNNRVLRPGEKSIARQIGEGVAIIGTAVAATAIIAAAANDNNYGGQRISPDDAKADSLTRQFGCTRSLRGCCSYRNGINNVIGRYVLCNNGQYSPDCRCF